MDLISADDRLLKSDCSRVLRSVIPLSGGDRNDKIGVPFRLPMMTVSSSSIAALESAALGGLAAGGRIPFCLLGGRIPLLVELTVEAFEVLRYPLAK